MYVKQMINNATDRDAMADVSSKFSKDLLNIQEEFNRTVLGKTMNPKENANILTMLKGFAYFFDKHIVQDFLVFSSLNQSK